MVDPVYCRRLLEQAISVVPHGKIHVYGSDLGDCVERSWAHTELARDIVATALANLVEAQWMDLDEAKAVAEDWFFNNPNRFFRLDIDRREGA